MAGVVKKPSESASDRAREFEVFKERVKDAYPIDRAIEDLAGVKFNGRPGTGQRMACCPFHDDRTPSFSVNVEHGFYKCFGSSCGAQGDVFSFIQEWEGVNFATALKIAAERAGIEPPDALQKGPIPRAPRKRKTPADDLGVANPASLAPNDMAPVPSSYPQLQSGSWVAGWSFGSAKSDPAVRKYRPDMVHEYRTIEGRLLCCVLRLERPRESGGKFFMPVRPMDLPKEAPQAIVSEVTSAGARRGWAFKATTSGARRPIYNIDATRDWLARGGRKVLLIEGEKTCDAGHRMLARHGWLVLSPFGGGKSAAFCDWDAFIAELAQQNVGNIQMLIWPDADPETVKRDGTRVDPQREYARVMIGGFISAATRLGYDTGGMRFGRVKPPADAPKGWDIADAESDGWSVTQLRAYIAGNSVKEKVDERFRKAASPQSVRRADLPVPFDGGDDMSVTISETMLAHDAEDNCETSDMPHVKSNLPDNDNVLTVPDRARPVGVVAPEISEIHDGVDLDDIALPDDDDGDTSETPGATVEGSGFGTRLEVREVAEKAAPGASPDTGDDDGDDGWDPRDEAVRHNAHFRPLGYLSNVHYFMSLRSGEILSIAPSAMRPANYMMLAPREFWSERFPGRGRGGNDVVDWESVCNSLVKASFNAGLWDPALEVGQGARIDAGRVTFNTGDKLWVEGSGIWDPQYYAGEYHYTMRRACTCPDFDDPFTADSPEPRQMLEIVRAINWRRGSRELSIMALYGWLCVGPICGILKWRPHLWLDGQRGSGKSWIVENVVKSVLGNYALNVTSNSTEPGLRSELTTRNFPLVFDEAEGENQNDRTRMHAIIQMARHAADPNDAFVLQGVSGGGSGRFQSIQSTFLLASITAQLNAPADRTRFARAHLGDGLNGRDFEEHLERPAHDLLTPTFSRRFVARVVMRAHDYEATRKVIVQGLAQMGLERRFADLYGAFAAGAWIVLEDGVPRSAAEAVAWLSETFGSLDQIVQTSDESGHEKDHVRLFAHIRAHELRFDTEGQGLRSNTVGELIDMIFGEYEHEDALTRAQADKQLSRIGIRAGKDGKIVKDYDDVTSLLIHKNSPALVKILADTPYNGSYADVILQGENVKTGGIVRFSGHNASRCLEVPRGYFRFGEGDHVDT